MFKKLYLICCGNGCINCINYNRIKYNHINYNFIYNFKNYNHILKLNIKYK